MAKNKIAVAQDTYIQVTEAKSPVEGMSREEFFMVFSAFVAKGNTLEAAFKLTKQNMPKILRAIES